MSFIWKVLEVRPQCLWEAGDLMEVWQLPLFSLMRSSGPFVFWGCIIHHGYLQFLKCLKLFWVFLLREIKTNDPCNPMSSQPYFLNWSQSSGREAFCNSAVWYSFNWRYQRSNLEPYICNAQPVCYQWSVAFPQVFSWPFCSGWNLFNICLKQNIQRLLGI